MNKKRDILKILTSPYLNKAYKCTIYSLFNCTIFRYLILVRSTYNKTVDLANTVAKSSHNWSCVMHTKS